jgi:uncharacterized membrane protein YdfJ with MMPL/SSD domain
VVRHLLLGCGSSDGQLAATQATGRDQQRDDLLPARRERRGDGWQVTEFVVALGVDYNIFLVSRIREEAAKLGTTNGTIEALARTGGVIARAGAVLAGTFLVMAGMSFYTMVHVGVGVALGILFDTFIVRSFLVPAMMTLLGERNWWPRHVHAPIPSASWSAAR